MSDTDVTEAGKTAVEAAEWVVAVITGVVIVGGADEIVPRDDR